MNWDNPTDVLKALLIVYSNQTSDEKVIGGTIYDNGVGFNSSDATFLTSICIRLFKDHKPISSNQYEAVRGALRKYHGQISDSTLNHVTLSNFEHIYPSRKEEKKIDGIIGFEDGEIRFKPNVYPSNQVKELGFKWRSPFWVTAYDPAKVRALTEMFPTAEKSEELLAYENSLETNHIIEYKNQSLKAFQKEAVSFGCTFRRSFIGLAPGLGKSAVAIEAAQQMGGRTLIISPLSLMGNWRSEIKKWTGDDAQIWHQTLRKSSKWVITNYESILGLWITYDIKIVEKNGRKRRELVNWECIVDHDFDNLIIDESLLIKNRKAQRSRAVFQVAQTMRNVWLLSGNPVSRLYDDLWHQLHTIRPDRYTSYWKFAETYCHVEQNRWGYQIVANKADAEHNLRKDLFDVMFARTQAQVTDIPDWIFENYQIDMLPEQYTMYKQMENEFIAQLPDGDVVVASIILTQLLRLVQIASNPVLIGGNDVSGKWRAIPETLEFVQFPVILWTGFKMTADMIGISLSKKYSVATLTGDTPQESRLGIVNNFQDGKTDVLVAHPAVGKYGFTLTAARTALYMERGYNGDDYYQSLYRVKRIGTTQSPYIVHMMSSRPDNPTAPTVDHVIHRILEYRKDNSIAITSGMIREAFERKWND